MLDPTSLIDRLYLIIINHKVLLGRVAAHEPLRGREWFFQAPPRSPEIARRRDHRRLHRPGSPEIITSPHISPFLRPAHPNLCPPAATRRSSGSTNRRPPARGEVVLESV